MIDASQLAREIAGRADPKSTILGRALAGALAPRLLRTAADISRREDLYAWFERTVAAIPLDAQLASALGSAPALVRDAGVPGSDVPIWTELEREFSAILSRAQTSLRREHQEDEIEAAIATLLVYVDEGNPLTAEHSRAVSLWCRRLALRLNLPDADVTFAARCGLLHDVGKAHTPAAILEAPRALTDDEWTIMRDHTVAGARMLAAIERLRPFERAARSHHERLDGKGYPDGLPAAAISTVVRIVTVADCFNAMIGRRPYRLPLSPERALEQLVKHSGTQFDPDVVAAMVDIVERP